MPRTTLALLIALPLIVRPDLAGHAPMIVAQSTASPVQATPTTPGASPASAPAAPTSATPPSAPTTKSPPAVPPKPEDSPLYVEGYSDGCASANLRYARQEHVKPGRDPKLYGSDTDYHSGWDHGYRKCEDKISPGGLSVPGNSVIM